MQMHNNTILITGASSGIGKGLAEAFHQRGNQVLISGRREDRLKEICQRHPGMRYLVLDVTSPEAIHSLAHRVIAEFPALNCLFNNAGVQLRIEFGPSGPLNEHDLQTEIDTNLLGPIRIAAAFLPHLVRQPTATLVNVSSGLAFVPMTRFPVYCATKAAIHSWTLSLRQQLRDSSVQVLELIPPYVATELGGPGKPVLNTSAGRGPMRLDAFVAETMKELETATAEVAIGEAKRLVAATSLDAVKKVFAAINS